MRYFASLTASLLVIAGITSPVHAETVLKLGHVSSAENVYHKGALRFAERVAELTDGSVTVDALCCAQLGNDVAQAKTVQLGAQDLAIVSSNNLAQFYPAIDIFSLPALFEDIPSAQKAVFGPVGDEIFENFRKATGMRVVYTTAWGTRALINDKRSIKQPSDLDGILIRSPGSPVRTTPSTTRIPTTPRCRTRRSCATSCTTPTRATSSSTASAARG